MATLHVKVINPDKIVYEGDADYVIAPGSKGGLGLLPGHTPIFAELVKGDIYIAGKDEQVLSIEAGILKLKADSVTILIGL